MTTISIIITSYNHADTISKAIDSVLCQQGDFNLEVIVIDDGSTDGSIKLLTTKYAGRVILYCNPHCGMMPSFIFGLMLSKGEFIAFCDCDDWWTTPDKLAMQLRYMRLNPDCGLCVTKAQTLYKGVFHGMGYPNINFDTLLRGGANIHAHTYFVRRETLFKYMDFDQYRKFSVWDYPIVLELIHHCKFHCIDAYTAIYNRSEESFTRTNSRKRRFKYLLGNYKIRLFFIRKYGCRVSTAFYFIYKITRDLYSIIFKRWTK